LKNIAEECAIIPNTFKKYFQSERELKNNIKHLQSNFSFFWVIVSRKDLKDFSSTFLFE